MRKSRSCLEQNTVGGEANAGSVDVRAVSCKRVTCACDVCHRRGDSGVLVTARQCGRCMTDDTVTISRLRHTHVLKRPQALVLF